MTLKFLGDTDVNRIAEIGSLVEQAAHSRNPCVVKVAGLGVFPHLERPNVVWAGLEGTETLRQSQPTWRRVSKNLASPVRTGRSSRI